MAANISGPLSLYIAPTVALVLSISKNTGHRGFEDEIRIVGGGLGTDLSVDDTNTTVLVITPDQILKNNAVIAFTQTKSIFFLLVDESHLL